MADEKRVQARRPSGKDLAIAFGLNRIKGSAETIWRAQKEFLRGGTFGSISLQRRVIREPDFSRGGLNRLSGPLGPENWITSTPILTRTSRAVYAKGAVRAARWVVGRPPGVYGIREVLGL